MTRSSPRGFTLIELLVIIAILGILMGLAFCGVQRARDSAGRLECANNLKQIGLALHSYHDTYGVLPPGCSYRGGADPTPHMSWLTRLLPHLEQEALWQQALRAYRDEKFFERGPHLPILARVQPLFSCPADGRTSRAPEVRGLAGPIRVGLTSYLGVLGVDRERRDGTLFLDSAAAPTASRP